MKVAVFNTKSYDKEFLDRFNSPENHQLVYFVAPLNKDTVNLTKGYDAVCVFVNDKIDQPTVEQLSSNGVKLIALRCAGFNNVDLKAAANYNIKVVRVPSYSPQAVAEHAVALIMTLNRKTHKAYNRVRENNFSLEKLTGFDLYEKTIGVIGAGKIGQAFCKIMLGFGCKVLAYDVFESDSLKENGVRYLPFEEIMKVSDVISLHCPLTPETHHLIDTEAFSLMKTGVMLINTSRGALIHTKDAITALKKAKLGYLGIDVYEEEENLFFNDLSDSIIQDDEISRLMTFPNVLITAHQAFFTKEALGQIARTTLANLTDVENGVQTSNEVE
ncbi:MAG: 2-hydroxyacid dehydrogenase [Paludibacter sp.]|nr:2-hydroxyacid dehydrogenase [Paludibacter sp.]